MKRAHLLFLSLALILSLALSACSVESNSNLTASGYLTALEVPVAPEVSGRVLEINVEEGDTVSAGDVLFTIEDDFLQAQYNQAQAGVDAAAATLSAAQAQLVYAQNQRDLALQSARAQDPYSRVNAWTAETSVEDQPGWYFQKSERVAAAQIEVDAAQAALDKELEDLKQELEKVSSQNFTKMEKRLNEAQAKLAVAEITLEQAEASNEDLLIESAQNNLDLAQSELDVARLEYNRVLNTTAADAVLTARANVAIAQARSDNARDALFQLQTGDESVLVASAEAGVAQAEAAISQAEANASQANAALALLQLQLDRAAVTAPIDGIIMTRNLEAGELAAAGGVVMIIGQLEDLTLTVYIPEDRYGQVTLGQQVAITVDSFPNAAFSGKVMRIASEAEFTPRNVQTADGRTSTVYAVVISVPNPDARLKPGMPADVTFALSNR